MTDKTTPQKHLLDLHFEHQLWASTAKFYTDELKIYEHRLEEIASKNTGDEVRKQVEHFQNKFIIQREQLDLLNNEVDLHRHSLAALAKDNPLGIDHYMFGNHESLSDKMDTFNKIYSELKKEFHQFISVWM